MYVLCSILFLVLCIDVGNPKVDLLAEKRSYVSKLSTLYNVLGLGETALLEEVLLPAMIVEQINKAGSSQPRTYVHAQDITVKHLDPVLGDFNVLISVQSLSKGVARLNVSGYADFNALTIKITSMERIEPLVDTSFQLNKVTFNNGSNGIDELIKMEKNTKCVRDSKDCCKQGSVVMDTWVNQTLQYQRLLSYSLPINYVQFIGSHNSFNNKADGYGKGDFMLGRILETLSRGKWDFVWAQQWFSITDQLNMGIRHLMLDPVYFWGEMRLCHCGGGSVKWFDNVVKYVDKVFHVKIDFDSHDLGCMPYDRLFSSAIQEIYDWMKVPGHGKEVVMVYINDESNDSDWGHIDLIQGPVANITSDILFTPKDKEAMFPNNRWPTSSELIQVGKTLIITCTNRCSNEYIFPDMMIPYWDQDTVKYFRPFPDCTGYHPSDWYIVGGESQVVGPIYNGPKEEGLVIKENFFDLLSCPVSVTQLDLASPELMSSAIWSWNVGYSVMNITNTSCPVIDLTGRWSTIPCNQPLYHACSSHNDSYSFSISSSPGIWKEPKCQDGSEFGLPLDGYQNRRVVTLLSNHQMQPNKIWINATKIPTV